MGVIIYTLHEPNGELRYVGKTSLSPNRRFRAHLSNARRFSPPRSHLGAWIRSLLAIGQEPELRILQEIHEDHWAAAEKYWISYFRAEGCRLVNHADGGEGPTGHRHSAEVCERIAAKNRGRHHTPEAKRLISEMAKVRPVRTGWQHSEEAKAHMREGHAKRPRKNYKSLGVSRRLAPVANQSMQDMNSGSSNGRAKLSEEVVLSIKMLLTEAQLTHREIGDLFGVSREAIGMIQRGKRWASVPWPELGKL